MSSRRSYAAPNLNFMALRLYEREQEIALLREAYKCSANALQIAWVHGYSGVGKSTLVEHVFQNEGYYCSGKFEKQGASRPYSALAEVLSRLCYILEFDDHKVNLSDEDASILSQLVPDVTTVLNFEFQNGPVSSNREWGLGRLKQTVRYFLKAVCSSSVGSPVILFFDDLQWADVDTLEIIKDMASDAEIKGILFVLSYRDNEVNDGDALFQVIDELRDLGADRTVDVKVTNLDASTTDQMVADLIDIPLYGARPLSKLIHSKTDGNCFFTIQVLRHIHNKELLYISKTTQCWDWDAEKIRKEVDSCENVVDFMAKTIRTLPSKCAEALAVSSCLGTTVDIELLESLLPVLYPEMNEVTALNVLSPAVEASLIEIHPSQKRFKFSHNRATAAAYEQIPEGEQRVSLHLKIGRHLQTLTLSRVTPQTQWLFVLAVDQLNRGAALIEAKPERVEVARLNLTVAQRVVKSSAFKLAESFLKMGIGLLDDPKWENEYDLALELSNLHASVLFSNGKMTESLKQVDAIYERARLQEDRLQAQIIHVELLGCTSRLSECLQVGLKILADLGHPKIPSKPHPLVHIIPGILTVKKLLKGKTDEDLLTLPACEDPKKLLIMKHLSFLSPIAYFAGRPDLIPVLTCRMMMLSLRFGLTDRSAYAFCGYGITLSVMNDLNGASRFGTMALKLMERFPEDVRTLVSVHGLLSHLRKPLHECVNTTLQGYHRAFSLGDLKFAGQAIVLHCLARYTAGLPLDNLAKDSFTFHKQLEKYGQRVMSKVMLVLRKAIVEIIGRSDQDEAFRLKGAELDDKGFEAFLVQEEEGKTVVSMFWMLFGQARYYLGDLESSLSFAEKWRRARDRKPLFANRPVFYTVSALTYIHFWHKTRKQCYWKRFQRFRRYLKGLVEQGNINGKHLDALLDAEDLVARGGTPADIRKAYGRAISHASRCGFVHDAALANEQAGRHFLKAYDLYWANHYLTTAKELYADWNATAKVDGMEAEFGDLVASNREPSKRFLTRSNSSSRQKRNFSLQGRSRDEIVAAVEAKRSDDRLVMEPSDSFHELLPPLPQT